MIISNSEGRWAKQHEFPGGILSFLITYGATLLEINYSVLQNPYIISIRIKRAKQNTLVSRSWLLFIKTWQLTLTKNPSSTKKGFLLPCLVYRDLIILHVSRDK